MEKEQITHYVKNQQCNHDSAKYSKAAWIPLVLDFTCGKRHDQELCPYASNLQMKGKGSCLVIWTLRESTGREVQVLQQMLSGTTFPLTCQYCLCFLQPLPGSQWSTRNVEKFVYNLGNYIRHLAFAQMPCAVWKFTGFSSDSQDRGIQGGFLLELGLKESQTNFLTLLAVK